MMAFCATAVAHSLSISLPLLDLVSQFFLHFPRLFFPVDFLRLFHNWLAIHSPILGLPILFSFVLILLVGSDIFFLFFAPILDWSPLSKSIDPLSFFFPFCSRQSPVVPRIDLYLFSLFLSVLNAHTFLFLVFFVLFPLLCESLFLFSDSLWFFVFLFSLFPDFFSLISFLFTLRMFPV